MAGLLFAMMFFLLSSVAESSCPHLSLPRVRRQSFQTSLNSVTATANRLIGLLPGDFIPISPSSSQNLSEILREAEQEAHRQWGERGATELLQVVRGTGNINTRDSFPIGFVVGETILELNRLAFLMEVISRYVSVKTGNVTGLEGITLRNTTLEYLCLPEFECDSEAVYRTPQGHCNNLKYTNYGMSTGPFTRFLPYAYADGISAARGSDRPLPNARRISFSVMASTSFAMNDVTLLWLSFGQMITHDVVASNFPIPFPASQVECCTPEIARNPELSHPDCMPIIIPDNDPFYTQYQETCMHFQRHVGAPRQDCNLGPRSHMNARTSFLDCGSLYGLDDDTAGLLRSFVGGRLRSVVHDGREFPPSDDAQFFPTALADSGCNTDPTRESSFCILNGDFFGAVTPILSALSVMQLRQHNSLADRLSELNPNWDDEKIFQEARKIVIAAFQLIVYRDFLPVILDADTLTQHNLTIQEDGYFHGYDTEVNPGLIDEFGAVAFRMGHVAFPDQFSLMDYDGTVQRVIDVRETLTRPSNTSELDPYILGSTRTLINRIDNTITINLSNHLLRRADRARGLDEPFGLDLASLNIQRGRDHGLRPYNDYRESCGLPRAETFDDLEQWIPLDAVNRIRSVYQNVDDIDLFVGAMSENPLPEVVAGPTLSCLISEQFKRMKLGDRFYFENGGFLHSFTPDQLREVKRFTMARFICDFSDDLQEVQLQPFRLPSETNPVVPCADGSIAQMNLNAWRNE